MIAESDAKIAYWLTLMPSAPNEQIAGRAGAERARRCGATGNAWDCQSDLECAREPA